MHKLDVDKIIARNRDYDRHTFNPEKEIVCNKGGEKCGQNTRKTK
jgi:hypothetical protein